MIKKISIRNFESHEDTEVEFTDGLNLVIGQSNQGKSSVVRALALVVANRFDKESVRTGKDFCTVKVETDKGYVEAERGESVNRWTVCRNGEEPQRYKNIGTGVPQGAMEVLGMGERTRGEVSELPNIMFQLEKHYMLSEIGEKKATSNMIARMMDDAIGIGGMEDLIKGMADDFASWKKKLNSLTGEISEKKSGIMDEDIFNDCEKSVGKAKKLVDSIAEAQKLLDDADDISSQMELVTGWLVRNAEELKVLETTLEAAGEVESQAETCRILERLEKTQEILKRIDAEGELIDNVQSLNASTETGLQKLGVLFQADSTEKRLNLIDSFDDGVFGDFESLANLQRKISDAEILLADARQRYVEIRKAEKSADENEKKLQEAEEAFHVMAKKLGTCPLCGAKLES